MVKNSAGAYDMPTLYDINGSANFYNKADYGLSIHRDKANNTVTVGVLKVKFRHLGETGNVLFRYNFNSGRYTSYEKGVPLDWDNSNHITTRLRQLEKDAEGGLPFEVYDESQEMPF
jgi:twinkle protein